MSGILFYHVGKTSGVSNSAGEDYGVYFAFEGYRHFSDGLCYLICHCFIDEGSFFIAVFDHILYLTAVCNAQI